MDIAPIQALFGSLLALLLGSNFALWFRMGQTVTNKDLNRLRDELRVEVKEIVDTAVNEATGDLNHRMNELQLDMNNQISGLRQDMNNQISELQLDMNNRMNELQLDMNNQISGLRQHMNNQISGLRQDMNNQISELRQDVNRVLAALANHEHVAGRVMITVQPDTEPAQVGDN